MLHTVANTRRTVPFASFDMAWPAATANMLRLASACCSVSAKPVPYLSLSLSLSLPRLARIPLIELRIVLLARAAHVSPQSPWHNLKTD